MKVLHVISGLNRGGAETFLVDLIRKTAGPEVEHVVASLTKQVPLASELQGRATLHVLGSGLFREGPRVAIRLRKLVRELKPDVIHGWMVHGCIAATYATGRGGSRPALVWGIRNSLPSDVTRNPVTSTLERLTSRWSHRPDLILYNSWHGRETYEAAGYRHVSGQVLANGVDLERYRPDAAARKAARAAHGCAKDTILVGRVGRFHPMKGYDVLAEAASKAVAREPRLRFVWMGPGVAADNGAVAGLVRKHGLEGVVSLVGESPKPETLYHALDILVSPSRLGEGYPNILAEAMACGVPCVASDTGDSAMLVGDTGIVVPAGDVDALAAGMLSLAHEVPAAAQARRTAAAELMRSKHDRRICMQAYMDAYAKAMKQARAR